MGTFSSDSAGRRALRRLSVFALCLSLGIAAGCGRPQQQQTSAPNAAPGGGTEPHVTAIASAALPAIVAAKPSGGVNMEGISTRSGGRESATTVAMRPADSLYLMGWAFPADGTGGCSAIGLAVDGKRVFPGTYGFRRADVAAFYKDRSRVDVGYSIVVPAADLGRGTHHAYVVCMDSAQGASRSHDPLTVTVR
jgi:hypothetical protein